jgi:uncharacterized membrane protein YedE/YeeE
MTLLLGFAIGMAFGAVLQLGGASSYRKIMDMLLLRDLTILKMILTGIAVGLIGIQTLGLVGLAHMDVKATYVAGTLLAGGLFGIGFALAGYCPGTGVVAAAEGKRDAVFMVAGGLVGAFVYALVHPALTSLLEVGAFGSITVPGVLGLPALAVALPLAAVIGVAVWRWIPTTTAPPKVPAQRAERRPLERRAA